MNTVLENKFDKVFDFQDCLVYSESPLDAPYVMDLNSMKGILVMKALLFKGIQTQSSKNLLDDLSTVCDYYLLNGTFK